QLEVSPPDALLLVDDEPQRGAELRLMPGRHRFQASAAGREPRQLEVSIDAGSTRRVVLDLPEVQANPPSVARRAAPVQPAAGLGTQRTVALVVGAVGVAGAAVGGMFGVRSMQKHSETERLCSGRTCSSDAGLAASDAALEAGTISTIGFSVAALALGGAAVLWFSAESASAERAQLEWNVGFASATVRTAF
ncbi:MAG TPA: hypothetical protein VJR89_06070, partial [Polyangiales bacterium]|nr:hypothetical protein [Polyangiales bacterium]